MAAPEEGKAMLNLDGTIHLLSPAQLVYDYRREVCV
jgi:hypothetical protein